MPPTSGGSNASSRSPGVSTIPTWEGARVFDVVHQLNRAVDLLDDEEERVELAMLNLKAGRRARQAAAYPVAAGYLEADISLLPIERIHKAAATMGDVLDDLLELSRVGRLLNPSETIELDALVREGVKLAHSRLEEGGVELRIESPCPPSTATGCAC